MFSHEQIIKLKEQIDFKKFYRHFLQLHQYGKYIRALCPFHDDSHPSLDIDEKSGLWICRSCNASGDIFSFYERITGKNFTESVLDIAKMFNIKMEISEEYRKELELKKALYTVNNTVATLYQQALSQNIKGQQYVLSRHFDIETIKKFKIGYIPKLPLINLGQQFVPFLKQNELINIYEDNTVRNYFSTNRISIPFFDENGHIVGFSSRAINNDIKPKYLHSRTSKLFKKDELLFAYNFAKQIIKETKSVIIVEGQIDCIRAHQYKIENCIATCGLALSEKQMKLLKTDVKNYYLVVEDKAGENAIDRLYDTIVENNYWANVKIIRLYSGDEKCDLDEFLTLNGKGAFLDKIKSAPTYHEYKLINSLTNINYKTIEEKKFHIYNNRKYIAKITNPIDKKQYIELLAQKLELPEIDVRKIISRYELTEDNIKIGEYDDRATTAQKYIIASFFSCFGVQKAYEINSKLKTQNKLEPKFKKIYEKIVNIILLYGADSDIINIIHSVDIMSSEELKIIDDAYFRSDELENLDDEEELQLFITDQLDNLK